MTTIANSPRTLNILPDEPSPLAFTPKITSTLISMFHEVDEYEFQRNGIPLPSESSQVDETHNPIHNRLNAVDATSSSAAHMYAEVAENVDDEFGLSSSLDINEEDNKNISSFTISDISEDELDASSEPMKMGAFRRLSKLMSSTIKVVSSTVAATSSGPTQAVATSSVTVQSGDGSGDGSGRNSRASSSAFHCPICLQKRDLARDGVSFASCSQEHVFCRPCLVAYTNVQIESDVKKHPCPCLHEGCDAIASTEEIRSLASPQNFERFSRLEVEEETATNPVWTTPRKINKKSNFNRNVFVQCPNCFAVITGGRSGNPQYPVTTCLANGCGMSFCFFHGQAHRSDMTCLQFAQETVNALALETTGPHSPASRMNDHALGVKHCPECKTATRKLDEWNSMYCSYCRGRWCWLCGRPADSNHFSPWNILSGCPGQETTDWETLRLSGEEGRKKQETSRKLYGWSMFSLYLMYEILRYGLVVAPIACMILVSAALASCLGPCVFLYVHIKDRADPGHQDVPQAAKTCPVPFTLRARHPFARIDDYLFVTTLYLLASFLPVWSVVLFLVWCPIGGVVITVGLLNSNDKAVLDVYKNLIGSAATMGFPDVVEFMVWPLGLPKYIFRHVFDS